MIDVGRSIVEASGDLRFFNSIIQRRGVKWSLRSLLDHPIFTNAGVLVFIERLLREEVELEM